MKGNFKRILISLAIPIVLIVAVVAVKFSNQNTAKKQYYQVVQMFQNNEVSEYSLNLYSGSLKYKLRDKGDKTFTHSTNI